MTTGDELLYEVDGAIGRITINRPERRNSLSWGVITGMREVLAQAKADKAVRVVVLTGAGDRAFCAGADLSGMGSGDSFTDRHHDRGELARLFMELYDLGKPTVARVRGFALAGGFGLALACDFVIASEDAQFGTPEIDVGLWPYMISVPLLRSMPPKKVLELMLTGRRVDSTEAERIGFVTRVVPNEGPGGLDEEVDKLCATLASKPPGIVRLGRDSFYAVVDQSAENALKMLHPMLSLTSMTEEAAEGINAFLEKRKPNWTL